MASQKLSKTIRDGIVEDIIADIPQVNYRAQAEKLMRDCISEQLPNEVKNMLKTPYAHRLDTGYFRCAFSNHTIQVAVRGAYTNAEKISDEVKARVMELGALHRTQLEQRDQLTRKVTSMLAAFTTVEQVRKACPEFEKYLPSPIQPVKNLPSVTNTVADLMLAGWPKGKEAPDAQP